MQNKQISNINQHNTHTYEIFINQVRVIKSGACILAMAFFWQMHILWKEKMEHQCEWIIYQASQACSSCVSIMRSRPQAEEQGICNASLSLISCQAISQCQPSTQGTLLELVVLTCKPFPLRMPKHPPPLLNIAACKNSDMTLQPHTHRLHKSQKSSKNKWSEAVFFQQRIH